MPTITELRELSNTKFASASDIEAVEQREFNNALFDYLEAIQGSIVKSKVVMLDDFTTDRNYSVATDLTAANQITSVVAMLVCKTINNGFAAGDTVTTPTPYPNDSGRTNAQGIGVQYNNLNPDTVKIMVNDQLTIMTAYNSASGALANNVMFSGGATANWSIKLIIGYI
jgi:hypothetical protein